MSVIASGKFVIVCYNLNPSVSKCIQENVENKKDIFDVFATLPFSLIPPLRNETGSRSVR